MLSHTAEYALRAAACLAADPAARMNQHQLAAATAIPPVYLYKVLQILARAGLLRANRGQQGGYRLARPPATITALDIVRAISTPRPVSPLIEPVAAALDRTLCQWTLADLVGRKPDMPTLVLHEPPSPGADWAVWNARAG